MGRLHVSSLLLTLFIVLVLFGTKRLRNMGDDLATAIKSFRKGLKDQDPSQESSKDQ